jgi:hypothetical protein
VAKSTPTAIKLGMHDHKAVGELPLRGHCPIRSQLMGNQKGMENTSFETLVRDLT